MSACFLNSKNEHILWTYYEIFKELANDDGFNPIAVEFFRFHQKEYK